MVEAGVILGLYLSYAFKVFLPSDARRAKFNRSAAKSNTKCFQCNEFLLNFTFLLLIFSRHLTKKRIQIDSIGIVSKCRRHRPPDGTPNPIRIRTRSRREIASVLRASAAKKLERRTRKIRSEPCSTLRLTIKLFMRILHWTSLSCKKS